MPRGTPGLSVGEREKNMGLKALATYELAARGLRVPGARLGVQRRDFTPLLNRSRVALASLAVGVARAAFEYARDYAKERQAFGVAIAPEAGDRLHARRDGDRDRRHAPADLGSGVEASTAAKTPRARPAWPSNYAANMALKVTDNAVQVLGGHGYIRDHLVELFLRNARGFATFEGLAIA